jgi:hypothetical protein
MFHRVLAACAVALLLVCVPAALTAQDKEARAVNQAPVLGWLAGIWGDLAAWLASEALPAPPWSSAGTSGDTGCLIDPAGCAHGG